jgi:hypothetical protein
VLQDNGEPLTTHAVRWAVDALSDGYDTPSLRILAGLDLVGLPNSFEAGTLVDAAMQELAIPKTDRNTRARLYVREVCGAMIASELPPLYGAERKRQMLRGSNYDQGNWIKYRWPNVLGCDVSCRA